MPFNVRPEDDDEQTPGATPLSRSYNDTIRSTMDRMANRPNRFTSPDRGEAISVDRTPRPGGGLQDRLGLYRALAKIVPGAGLDPATANEVKEAVVVNPNHPLARFARHAFPGMYRHLDRAPQNWQFEIANRRNPMQGQYDLYKYGAAGATKAPEGQIPGSVAVRQDTWGRMINRPNADNTLGHELQHAVQYKPGQAYHVPARRVVGDRLRQMLKTASKAKSTQDGENLNTFAAQYEKQGSSPAIAAREGLTEAAGRAATRRAVRSSAYEQARRAGKGEIE